MHWFDWSDPTFTLPFASVVLAVLIPLAIALVGLRIGRQADAIGRRTQQQLRDLQSAQLALNRTQRRDYMLATLPVISSHVQFALMTAEIGEYEGKTAQLLRSASRQNPLSPLPASGSLSEQDADDYVQSLPGRFQGATTYERFPGLLQFISLCRRRLACEDVHFAAFTDLVCGQAGLARMPGHNFYREIVKDGSWRLAAPLLYKCRDIKSVSAGLTANVLTGVLLAVKQISVAGGDYFREKNASAGGEADFRTDVKMAIGSLLHPNYLSDIGRWNLAGFTEATSAPVAWLILAAGYVADHDEHVEMRIIESLADVVESLTGRDRSWGMDERDVKQGLVDLRRKCPLLWAEHGHRLLIATGFTESTLNLPMDPRWKADGDNTMFAKLPEE